MSTTAEERWAERDRKREALEAQMAEREQARRAQPLIERLRDCGTRIMEDGHPSCFTPHEADAKEAADLIEAIQREIDGWDSTDRPAEILDRIADLLGR